MLAEVLVLNGGYIGVGKAVEQGNRSVGVFVCARGHSTGLVACLKSLRDQELADGWSLSSVNIVWNSPDDVATHATELLHGQVGRHFRQGTSVNYYVENTIGIPSARNRALDAADEQQIGWIAFVDDDCVAETDLLFRLTERANQSDADAVAGGWSFVPAGPISSWLPPEVFGRKDYRLEGKPLGDGAKIPTAYTRNVMFRRQAQKSERNPAPRFWELFPGAGGSDVLFFFALSKEGKSIVYAREAVVTESYSGNRLKLRWHVLRLIRTSQQRYLRRTITNERAFPLRLGFGFLTAALRLPFIVVFFPLTFVSLKSRRWIGSAILRFAPYLGVLLAILGLKYREYETSKRPNTLRPGSRVNGQQVLDDSLPNS